MRGLFVALVIGSVWLGCPVSAGAHRLDEYLQATRLSIAVDCVGLELDMTAGVNVAPHVVASIDTNRDGQISSAEGDLYARRANPLSLILNPKSQIPNPESRIAETGSRFKDSGFRISLGIKGLGIKD